MKDFLKSLLQLARSQYHKEPNNNDNHRYSEMARLQDELEERVSNAQQKQTSIEVDTPEGHTFYFVKEEGKGKKKLLSPSSVPIFYLPFSHSLNLFSLYLVP